MSVGNDVFSPKAFILIGCVFFVLGLIASTFIPAEQPTPDIENTIKTQKQKIAELEHAIVIQHQKITILEEALK